MTTRDLSPKPGIQRWAPKLVLLALCAAVWALILTGCSDSTGPSEPTWPSTQDIEWRPQFQKTAQDGLGNGGGGSGGDARCTRPTASVECALKAAGLTILGGGIAACSWAGCVAGIPGWGIGAWDYINTPDCRSCNGPSDHGYGTGRSIGPTDERNRAPGSPPDTGGW